MVRQTKPEPAFFYVVQALFSGKLIDYHSSALVFARKFLRFAVTPPVRLRIIPDASAASLIPFVVQHVKLGAIIHTDGWPSYNALKKEGYDHRPMGGTLRFVLPAATFMRRLRCAYMVSLITQLMCGFFCI